MGFIEVETSEGIRTLRLNRPPVNALTGDVVDELTAALDAAEADEGTRAIVLTGAGKFFSFGFDVPEFLGDPRERFTDFLARFTRLYERLFTFPRPVVGALNGHAVAGGAMLALACDVRVIADGRAKFGLNEIAIGASVFAGCAAMLRFRAGGANATRVLYAGALHTAGEALRLGLVDEVAGEDDVPRAARIVAAALAAQDPAAFAGIKKLLTGPVAEDFRAREDASIREFVDIWYSGATRAKLRDVRIR